MKTGNGNIRPKNETETAKNGRAIQLMKALQKIRELKDSQTRIKNGTANKTRAEAETMKNGISIKPIRESGRMKRLIKAVRIKAGIIKKIVTIASLKAVLSEKSEKGKKLCKKPGKPSLIIQKTILRADEWVLP
jgi:hypothetical protein